MHFARRFPSRSEVFAVYSVIVFWAYTWGVLMFMFDLPGWMLMASLWEILGYFSYGAAAIFLDTLILLGLVLGLSALLPGAWLRDDFSVSGGVLAGMLFAWITFAQVSFGVLATLPVNTLLLLFLTALAILVLTIVIVRRLPPLRRFALWAASSSAIFVYIYGFLTALGFVVILLRNIV
jgi:hypothetical protein